MYGFLQKIFKNFCLRVLRGFAGSRGEMRKTMPQILRRKIRQRKETTCKRYVIMLCNNSISTIHEKNKTQVSLSLSSILFRPHPLLLQAFPLHALFLYSSPFSHLSLLLSSTSPCLSQKDTPRAFGASLRRHAAP